MQTPAPLLAVDIGNSRIKIGFFDGLSQGSGVRMPSRVLNLPTVDWDPSVVHEWLNGVPNNTPWRIASVNRQATAKLISFVSTLTAAPIQEVCYADLPLDVALPEPERVGIDRLAGAAAANRLRDPSRPAIVIQVGTAITVNLVTADGKFRGGAILPGIGMSTRALERYTDLLPNVELEELCEPQPVLGTSTIESIRSGLYWGAVGAMRELIARLSATLDQPPEVFLTGGAAPSVAATLNVGARYVEHLVLAGIALANCKN